LKSEKPLDAPIRDKSIYYAYCGVAQLWIALAGPPSFAASCTWSVARSMKPIVAAVILSIIGLALFSTALLRWAQAKRLKPIPLETV
jgi:CHASE2 domain-containing sensor protein